MVSDFKFMDVIFQYEAQRLINLRCNIYFICN